MLRGGLPLTPKPRTVSDLGQLLDEEAFRTLFADLVLHGEVSRGAVLHAADGLSHKAGTGLVRRVGWELSPEFESYLERVLGAGLVGRGLPWWRPQLEVRARHGLLLAVADFGDEASRTLVETDGFAYHGSRVQQRRDKARDRRLARTGGWLTLRYGADEVLGQLEATLDEMEAVRMSRLAA